MMGLALAFVAIGYGLGYFTWGMQSRPDNSMMQHAMDQMTGGIQGLSGDAFDKAFLSEMTDHHRGALEMANMAKENAGHQELKDFAQRIIDAQSAEIAQMQQWMQAWYGSR